MKKLCNAVSRRDFILKGAMAAAATPLFFGTSFGQAGQRRAGRPGGKLNHACIGVGGMGAHDLGQFKSHPKVQIVALCDVDEERLKAAAKQVPGARTYTDWRERTEESRVGNECASMVSIMWEPSS